MLKPYRTIQDVLVSPWAQQPKSARVERTDRVLRSTKLENSIYQDLRSEDTAMDAVEQSAGKKLKSFPALSQDVFQSFYSLVPRHNEEGVLLCGARKFTRRSGAYHAKRGIPTLKEVAKVGSYRL